MRSISSSATTVHRLVGLTNWQGSFRRRPSLGKIRRLAGRLGSRMLGCLPICRAKHTPRHGPSNNGTIGRHCWLFGRGLSLLRLYCRRRLTWLWRPLRRQYYRRRSRNHCHFTSFASRHSRLDSTFQYLVSLSQVTTVAMRNNSVAQLGPLISQQRYRLEQSDILLNTPTMDVENSRSRCRLDLGNGSLVQLVHLFKTWWSR